MAEQGEKPGFLDGLSKAFFHDVPYSTNLSRGEQDLRESVRSNELARRQLVELKDIEEGQRDTSSKMGRLVQETGRAGDVAERMLAPLLRNIGMGLAHGNEEIQERLRELRTAFNDGNQRLASTMSDVGDQVGGIPNKPRSLAELLASGAVDEVETVVLAAGGILDRTQADRFLSSLDGWKIDLINSGLATRVDVKAEKALSSEQKTYLSRLRSRVETNPANFRSLPVLAQKGLLDEEMHHALAERIPGVRFGVEGVKYEVRDLGQKTSVLVDQGAEMLRRSDVQIGLSRRGVEDGAIRVVQNGIAITQREVALRLMRAGILKTEELVEVARDTRSVLGDSLSVQEELVEVARDTRSVLGDSLSVQRDSLSVQTQSLRTGEAILGGIDNLGHLAARAEFDRGAIVQHTGDTARSTAETARYASAMVPLLADIAVSGLAIQNGIGNLDETFHHYGSIQAAQMHEAQGTRLAQLELSRALVEIGARNSESLTRIADGMVALTEVEERQLDQLTGIREDTIVLRKIGIAILETSDRALDALGDLRQTLAVGVVNIVQVIDAVRQTLVGMEERAIERDQNSEQNLALQSFRKAMAMMDIGRIDKAISFFNESEERWPADFWMYLYRGRCHVLKNDPRAAESDFSDAIKLAKGKKEARMRSLIRLNLARLYYDESKVHFERGNQDIYEEKLLSAIEEAKRAVEDDPKFSKAQFDLATYLAAFKLFSEALDILVRIIPKNPDFVEKLDHFDVFTPLRDALKNTLGEDFVAHDKVKVSRANLSIARDCVENGDFETAKKCLNYLFEKDPAYLRESRVWEIPEFGVLAEDIASIARNFLNFAGKHEEEWGYAVISIALHFPKIGRGAIYTAFRASVQKDPDFAARRPKKIKEKLVIFADDMVNQLFELIVSKNPRDLPEWLIAELLKNLD